MSEQNHPSTGPTDTAGDQWIRLRDEFQLLFEERRGKFPYIVNIPDADMVERIKQNFSLNAISNPTKWEQGGIIDVEESDDKALTENFIERVKVIETKAAYCLGMPEVRPIAFWRGAVSRHLKRTKLNVCEDSATFCSYLARTALKGDTAARIEIPVGKIRKARGISQFTRAVRKALVNAPGASGLEICRSIDEDGVPETPNMKSRSYQDTYQNDRRAAKGLDSRFTRIRNRMKLEGILS